MKKEIWKQIKGYEGLYEVSNFGNIMSLNYKRTGQVNVLSPVEDKDGYLYVGLHKNGKQKICFIHRLVAEAFIPNWFDYPQVNHKDENKQNNHIDNLEWCDCKYNSNFGTRNERRVKKQSKPVLQLTKTGEFVREWSSTAEAGRNGFDQGGVSNCCRGKLKHYKGFIWKYKEAS